MKKLITVLFFIAVLAKGSFFGTTGVFLGLLILLALLLQLRKMPPKKMTFLLLILSIVYLGSAFVNYFSFENLIFALKPFICLLFLVLVFQVEDREYLGKVVLFGGVVVAVIGLNAFTGFFELEGMVTAKRLQSTFQYANATGAFLAACALLARSREYAKYKSMILILETSLLLTQSVGALMTYFFCLGLGLVLQDNDARPAFYSETILRLFLAFLFAALLYGSKYVIQTPLLSLGVLGVLFFSMKYGQKFIDKLRNRITSFVASLGMVASVVFFAFLRGRAFYTYIERIIQISDGIKVLLQKPLLGIGPGNWQNVRYAYQSADYQTGYMHSGLIQIGLEGGVLAVLLSLAIVTLVLMEFDRKHLFKHLTIYLILLHSVFDMTLNFMVINFLFCIVFSLLYTEPCQDICRHRQNWRLLLVVPLLLFVYLSYIQTWFNYTYANLNSVSLAESIEQCEKVRPYHFNSYEVNLLLAELYFHANDYSRFVDQIKHIPYKTAEVFFLEGQMELRQENYQGVLKRAFKCVELALHQEFGYELALEAIGQLPSTEQDHYKDRLDSYWETAQGARHPLAHFIVSQ